MTELLRHCIVSPVGPLTVEERGGAIVGIRFGGGPCGEAPTVLLRHAEEQLSEYFAGRRHEFDLPTAPAGTEFQKRVWRTLREIPYGTTCPYGEIARRIGSPHAARAVGMANNRNPIAIVIPCHRVVGHDGSLTGYAAGVGIKAALLALEAAHR